MATLDRNFSPNKKYRIFYFNFGKKVKTRVRNNKSISSEKSDFQSAGINGFLKMWKQVIDAQDPYH
ncbi:hypothetical protein [Chryseobacterium indoltheticum]|uniref:hypothetical protein n=1 Tax=Chryseobacterium indoltheticum TaxID=254 RepID=UPI003F496981